MDADDEPMIRNGLDEGGEHEIDAARMTTKRPYRHLVL